MHQVIDLEAVEERNGRMRVQWTCECGRKGSGASQRAAADGWKRHVRSANRKEYLG